MNRKCQSPVLPISEQLSTTSSFFNTPLQVFWFSLHTVVTPLTIYSLYQYLSSHRAILIRKYAAENNIRFAYFPPYPPDLNPIEQVWRAIKREVAATFITDLEHLMATITEAFTKLVAKRSYWKKWVLKFLSSKYSSKSLRE